MKASRRATLLGLALLGALLVALFWFSGKRHASLPNAPVKPPQPVASAVADAARQLTVEVFSHGRPLADSGVLVQHRELPQIFSSLKSDDRGKVVFASLPPGPYRVTAMHFGYAQTSRDIQLEQRDQALRLGLERVENLPAPSASSPALAPGGELRTLSGRVVDERGEPVPRAQVGVSSSAAPVFLQADEEGHFEFTNLSEARLNLFATAPGYAAAQLPQVAAGSSDVVVVMQDPAKLEGTVSFSSAVARLFVRLCHHDPTHDKELCIKSQYYSPPSEHYALDRLPPGEFDLVFSDGQRELGRVPIKIASGEQLVVPPQRL